MMKPAFRKKAFGLPAFTLLELIITAALIGILALILVGSLNALSVSKNNVRCVSHLRQVGTAMLNYIADSDQTLKSFHGGANVDEMWSRKLFYGGYLAPNGRYSNEKTLLLYQIDNIGHLLRCPAGAIGPTFESKSSEVRNHPRRWGWQTYGLGMYHSDLPVKFETIEGKTTVSFQVKIAAISEPSRYILFADSSGGGPDYFQSFRISRYAGEGGVCLRHRGRANTFFLDGHINAIDADEARQLGVPEFHIFSP